MVVAISTQIYTSTKERLERRNLDLKQAVESEASLREIQDQELARAREIQMALLPKEIPQVSGFEIAGAWEPARTVGGDYFDVIRLSDTKLAICIADVVGKSVSAALLMANVQATVRAFASDAGSPAWLCGRVNSVLCSNIATGKFVTLFYGVLDAERGTLLYTNAGHLPPILISASGQVQQLSSNGALLGVFPNWKFEEASLHLSPGDRLMLFTDGITEAMSPSGEEFGEARLVELARGHSDLAPVTLKTQVLNDVKRFSDSQLHDDVTLVVLGVMAGQGTVVGRA
jgi:sigma-B regulation protein RsbU (phosphoserine phosphatase)